MKTSFSVLFRCDASGAIGAGHVMRCLTLSRALAEFGVSSVFVTNGGGSDLISRFSTVPVRVVVHDENDDIIEELRKEARFSEIRFIVWDSYDLSVEIEEQVVAIAPSLLLDDYYLLPRYSSKAILNQNIYAEADKYLTLAPHSDLLMGTRYSMIRDSFLPYRSKEKQTPPKATNIVLTFGGSDPQNETLKYLAWLDECRLDSLHIRVILGPHYAYLPEIKEQTRKSQWHRVELHHNVVNMADLLWDRDLAITASGSTMYELAFLGIPSCAIVTAENQRLVAQGFNDAQTAWTLGDSESVDRDLFLQAFNRLSTSENTRRTMSNSGRSLVDGLGANRVAEYIYKAVSGRGFKDE